MANSSSSSPNLPSPPGPRSTLRDVAMRSGLSLGTVSRILNGGNKGAWVSTAARETAVRAIAAKLGYTPNLRARSLRNQKSHTVALVCGVASPLLYGAYEALAGSIVGVLEAYRYNLLFLPLPADEVEAWPLDCLHNGRVDGCIAMDPLPDIVAEALRSSRLPFVAINVDRDVPCVRPDDADGMAQLLSHLIDLGHRRITFFAGDHPDGAHYSLAVRERAYFAGMAEHGLADFSHSRTGGVEAFVEDWCRLPFNARPTVVISYQGLQMLQLHQRLLLAGVKIPHEISLASFDDLPVMKWLTPAVTTVAVPIAEMGAVAAQMLVGRLERGQQLLPGVSWFSERLVIRDSTAKPPRST